MSDWPPLRDYSRSLAVLIGTWDYAFLDPVPAAGHSLRRMADLLAGPWCGWPRDRLVVQPNVPSPGDLPDQLITAFDAVTDVAVFYFVGHGQISPDDQLCLGLARSRPEPARRAATSLRFGDVRQALLDSKAAVKIVMLDCCFAGLATRPSLAGDVLDLTAGTGAYTMAATSAYTTAWYQDEPGLAQPQTYFTKYLADLVEEGMPRQPSRLRVDPVFRKLLANLAADGRPVPHRRAVDDAREFEFAYNAAPAETHRDPELELLRLAQRLEDEVARRAEAEARLQGLQAEVHERRLELERLQARTRHMEQLAASQQRQLLEAIDEAEQKLDHTTTILSMASGEADAPNFAPADGSQSESRSSAFTDSSEPPVSKVAGNTSSRSAKDSGWRGITNRDEGVLPVIPQEPDSLSYRPFEDEAGTQLRGRILIFTLIDDRQTEFDQLIGQAAKKVQEHEPGTLVYVTHTIPNAPMQRILYEVYRDRGAYDTHEQQPYISEFEASRRPCLLATNTIELTPQQVKILPLSSTSGLLGDSSADSVGAARSEQPVGRQLRGRILIFTLIDDRQAEFDQLIGQAAKKVQEHEPGTLVYVTHTIPNAPMQRILYEVYRDRGAYDTHEQQPYISEFEASRRPCLLATNTIELTPQHVVMKDSLPRLTETFLDVRGSSRSMQVSRYAKSEIPVISIFQGDMLIGSFRLPTEEILSAARALTSGPYSTDKNGVRREPSQADSAAAMQASSPRIGEHFFDVRGSSRSMRLSWRTDTGIFVISLWEGGVCTATIQLAPEQIPRLTDAVTGTSWSHAMRDRS